MIQQSQVGRHRYSQWTVLIRLTTALPDTSVPNCVLWAIWKQLESKAEKIHNLKHNLSCGAKPGNYERWKIKKHDPISCLSSFLSHRVQVTSTEKWRMPSGQMISLSMKPFYRTLYVLYVAVTLAAAIWLSSFLYVWKIALLTSELSQTPSHQSPDFMEINRKQLVFFIPQKPRGFSTKRKVQCPTPHTSWLVLKHSMQDWRCFVAKTVTLLTA